MPVPIRCEMPVLKAILQSSSTVSKIPMKYDFICWSLSALCCPPCNDIGRGRKIYHAYVSQYFELALAALVGVEQNHFLCLTSYCCFGYRILIISVWLKLIELKRHHLVFTSWKLLSLLFQVKI